MAASGRSIDGIVVRTGEGTPQGGPVSPVLANIYLHYVIDLWFDKRVKRGCKGTAHLVRFADDFVAGFQYQNEAKLFSLAVKRRLGDFCLEVAEEKTRLMGFGPYTKDRVKPGKSKTEVLTFWGFGIWVEGTVPDASKSSESQLQRVAASFSTMLSVATGS